MSRNKAVLPVPKGGKEQDWEAKRKTAIMAWELGRKTMVPKSKRPIPGSRLAAREESPAKK